MMEPNQVAETVHAAHVVDVIASESEHQPSDTPGLIRSYALLELQSSFSNHRIPASRRWNPSDLGTFDISILTAFPNVVRFQHSS